MKSITGDAISGAYGVVMGLAEYDMEVVEGEYDGVGGVTHTRGKSCQLPVSSTFFQVCFRYRWGLCQMVVYQRQCTVSPMCLVG
jgi:hypothetical protein